MSQGMSGVGGGGASMPDNTRLTPRPMARPPRAGGPQLSVGPGQAGVGPSRVSYGGLYPSKPAMVQFPWSRSPEPENPMESGGPQIGGGRMPAPSWGGPMSYGSPYGSPYGGFGGGMGMGGFEKPMWNGRPDGIQAQPYQQNPFQGGLGQLLQMLLMGRMGGGGFGGGMGWGR